MQPILDEPAIEQHPLLEHVSETVVTAKDPNSSIFLPIIGSYLLSFGGGALVAFLFNKVFGTPYQEGYLRASDDLWKMGIPLSIIASLLLGIGLPILFARKRRHLAIVWTLVLLVITLVVLIVMGLSQLPDAVA